MKERPILFSAPMVRAILDGRTVRIDVGDLRRAYESGATIKEIADSIGCSVQPVKRTLREAGVERRAARQRPGRMAGARNPSWRGGRRIRPDGYVEVWTPSGPRLEHQVVMERHLGRALIPGEVVHHRDRNKQNNTIANLELTTQSEHAREHAPEMHARRWGHA